jgi:hypothetical protein
MNQAVVVANETTSLLNNRLPARLESRLIQNEPCIEAERSAASAQHQSECTVRSAGCLATAASLLLLSGVAVCLCWMSFSAVDTRAIFLDSPVIRDMMNKRPLERPPRHTTGDTSAAPVTFQLLAQRLISTRYRQMLHALDTTLTDHVQPANVAEPRKRILATRDLMDCFSPVYSNQSLVSDSVNDDVWSVIRSSLDQGYTIMGQFLDLNHARIRYTPLELEAARTLMLQWKQSFDENIRHKGQHYLLHATAMTTSNKSAMGFSHVHSSRLFWGSYQGRLPSAGDAASKALQSLGVHQVDLSLQALERVEMYGYNATLFTATVAPEVIQEEYHSLRKLLRCLVDEYRLFQGHDVDMFGSSRSPTTVTASMDILQTARILLGDLNDQWTAWDFYRHRPETMRRGRVRSKRQAFLRNAIDYQWQAFQTWSHQVNLTGTLQALRENMKR